MGIAQIGFVLRGLGIAAAALVIAALIAAQPVASPPPLPWPDSEADLLGAWSTARAAIVVGNDGTILVSTDGLRWERRRSPFAGPLRAIWATRDAAAMFAVGDGGVVLRSRDGGETWAKVHAAAGLELTSVWGLETGEIFALGRRPYVQDECILLASRDGGDTWESRTFIGWAPWGVWGTAAALLLVIDDELLRSTDCGASWQPVRGAPAAIRHGWARPGLALAAGMAGEIFRSVDDGLTWTASTCIADREYRDPVFAFAEASPTEQYAVGGAALLCASHDGVATWTVGHDGDRAIVLAAVTAGPRGIVAAGHDHDHGRIFGRDRSGRWIARRGPSSQALNAIWGITTKVIIAVGDQGTIVRTIDGASWSRVASPSSADLYRIWGTGSHLFVVGDRGTLLVSHDGGVTFELHHLGADPQHGVWGNASFGTVFVAGRDGLFRSADFGDTWELTAAPQTDLGYTGVFVDGVHVYATAGRHVVDGYVEDDDNWTQTDVGTYADLVGIWCDYDACFAIGNHEILVSHDHNQSWLPMYQVNDARQVWGDERLDHGVFVVGNRGLIGQIKRRAEWYASGSVRRFSGVWQDEDLQLFAVGDGEMIVHSGDGGATWERQVVRDR